MRLVIIVSRGVGSPARIFVINGESWDLGTDGAWTAFQMLYCLHSMPIRPATPRWRGNSGGDRFLAEAARAGVAPTQMQARSWDHLLARAGKAGPDDVLLPTDILLKAMRDDVGASWARAGRETIRLPRHLAPRRARSSAGSSAEGDERRGGHSEAAAAEPAPSESSSSSAFVPGVGLGPESDDGSTAGSGADEPERPDAISDELSRAVRSVCTIVGCCRPSRMTAQFFDENGMHTDTICCEQYVTGEGHTAKVRRLVGGVAAAAAAVATAATTASRAARRLASALG